MFTDPYSGKFNLWQGAQNLGPLIMQYMLMKELMGNKGADMAGAKAQGMASMMPNRPMQQAQPMGGSYLQTVGGVAGGPGSATTGPDISALLKLLPIIIGAVAGGPAGAAAGTAAAGSGAGSASGIASILG